MIHELSICSAIQLILFIPFYLIWRADCKKFGKENLAVPLSERFLAWVICCPIWLVPFIGGSHG